LKKDWSAEKILSFLKEVTAIIRKNLRQAGDTVFKGPEGLMVLVEEDKETSEGITKRLQKKLQDYLIEHGLEKQLGFQVSYATYPDDGQNGEQLLMAAKKS